MREGARDLDQLLLPNPQRVGGRGRIEVAQAHARERLSRLVIQLGKADKPGAPRQAVQEDVLGYSERADDIEFLHHHDHARMFRLSLGARRVAAAIDLDLAAVGRGQSAQNARESGLARAVAAYQRMHLAMLQLEAEVRQHRHVVALVEATDLEQGCRRHDS